MAGPANFLRKDSPDSNVRPHQVRREILAAVAVVSFACGLRIFVWRNYGQESIGMDPQWYVDLSKTLFSRDFLHYQGERVPLYLLLNLVCGYDFETLRLINACLGTATSVLLYLSVHQECGSSWAALLAAAFYNMLLVPVMLEAQPMPDALACFFLTLFLTSWIVLQRSKSKPLLVLCGMSLSAAGLTRPECLIGLPVFFVLALADAWRADGAETRRDKISRLKWLAPPLLLPVLLWCAFLKISCGSFTPTTLTGYALMTIIGDKIEDAPEPYHAIRDLYIPERELTIRKSGNSSMAIWSGVIDRMMAATGESFAELSGTLGRLSLRLIWMHPGHYLKTAAHSFCHFFFGHPYRTTLTLHTVRSPVLKAYLERGTPMVLVGALNVMYFLLLPLVALRASRSGKCLSAASLSAFLVLAGALAQAMMALAANPRYLYTWITLVIFFVFSVCWPKVRPERLEPSP